MYEGSGLGASALPVTGAGVLAYSSDYGAMGMFVLFLAAFTLLMAARTIWRMAPFQGGDIR